MDIAQALKEAKYDKWYQDIECIGHVGYAQSWRSWENIKDLINWKDKSVLDIGCFHGYFCFKAEQAGAKLVIGIDKNEEALKTTALIAEKNASECDFFTMSAHEAIEKHIQQFDVILIMNVFHHIPEKDKLFKCMSSGQKLIMEIDKEDLTKVEEYCTILVKKLSHRPSAYTGDTPNRLILLAEKK